ncbi:uncharacterized protein LOC131626574 [Vicia villosa]|uniref:uncharacterized protein LOC131626574 n=1 Tax=Vicia villosa TaxID=3911 RepID=UPI00273CD47F|nr:uncharacterized protein LOC131626574 [Vicia villosa]
MHAPASSSHQVAYCELCTGDHQTGFCPPPNEEVNYMGNQQRTTPYQSSQNFQRGNNAKYGQGWRQDTGTANRPHQYQGYQQPHHPNQPDRTAKLEDTLQQFMQLSIANQKNTDASIKNLETQVGQIAKQLTDQQKGTFTATAQTNPKEHCKSITTRSGRVLETESNEKNEEKILEEKEREQVNEEKEKLHESHDEIIEERQKEENIMETNGARKNQQTREEKGKLISPPVQNLPYPHAPTKKDKERQYARFLDIFKRLQINIPFAEALEQMSTYAKFMKEILTKKRRITDEETIYLDASCSAIIQRTLPQKEKDPGRVTLPVTIENVNVGKALIDLGSSINLIPLSVIKRIGDLDMKHTRMTLQLADKSVTRPSGIAEDVLVKVDKFLFPIDFVVMDIEEDDDVPLILGRHFMKTARMMIDIDDGLMKVRVQDEEVSFNLFDAMKYPKEKGACFKVDTIEMELPRYKNKHI